MSSMLWFSRISILVFGVIFLIAPNKVRAETYTTSVGAVFQKVQYQGFKTAWQAPDGTIWSDALEGKFSNEDLDQVPPVEGEVRKTPATEACRAVGGRLPSFWDYFQLQTYFDMSVSPIGNHRRIFFKGNGLNDYRFLFPESKGKYFWERTLDIYAVENGDLSWAYFFVADNGSATNSGLRRHSTLWSVRCIHSTRGLK